jgi:acetyl/propionyl-CoA carboxylase alpha subunit
MIKAAAGGGGRGMRRCDDTGRCDRVPSCWTRRGPRRWPRSATATCCSNALIEDARHIEVQVFGDTHGNAVHLGERDCSTQRRHQKILEEAPSPGVDDALRARLGDAAVKLVRAVGYRGRRHAGIPARRRTAPSISWR